MSESRRGAGGPVRGDRRRPRVRRLVRRAGRCRHRPTETADTPLLGRPAPDAVGELADGTDFDLARRKGSWVVVNFFDPECVPCVEEHPELVAFDEQERSLRQSTVPNWSPSCSATTATEWPSSSPTRAATGRSSTTTTARSPRRSASPSCPRRGSSTPTGSSAGARSARSPPASSTRSIDQTQRAGGVMAADDSLNQLVKRWPGWLLLAVVAAVLLAVGVSGGNGVERPGRARRRPRPARGLPGLRWRERLRVAQPGVDQPAQRDHRRSSTKVGSSDDEILAEIQSAFPNDILLVPPADGVNVLVWALPAAAVVGAAAGLVVAFRRWRRGSRRRRAERRRPGDRAVGARRGRSRWAMTVGPRRPPSSSTRTALATLEEERIVPAALAARPRRRARRRGRRRARLHDAARRLHQARRRRHAGDRRRAAPACHAPARASWWRRLGVAAVIAAVAAGAGVLVARRQGTAWRGRRSPATLPGDGVASMLAEASGWSGPPTRWPRWSCTTTSSTLRPDHAEALTYSGWLLLSVGQQSSDEAIVADVVDEPRVSSSPRPSTPIPPTPTRTATLSIIAAEFDGDADVARAERATCLDARSPRRPPRPDRGLPAHLD